MASHELPAKYTQLPVIGDPHMGYICLKNTHTNIGNTLTKKRRLVHLLVKIFQKIYYEFGRHAMV